MKTKILTILTALAVLFAISCESPTNDDGKKDGNNVSFTGLTADGSADLTTNKLNLTFDKDIDGLSIGDITLNSGSTGAVKDNLTRNATGKYELSLKNITASGAVSVSVAKSGYNFTGQPKQVNVFYKQGSNPPNPGETGDIPAELVAKWFITQALADAGTTTVTLEFTADGKLLYMGIDNNLTISVENNVITYYRSGAKIGTLKYTLNGTAINFSESTGETVFSTSMPFYKKAETPIVVDIEVEFSELTADGSETKTTTFLTIKLDKEIPDFAVNDITFNPGTTGVQKGTLTPVNNNGTYKLGITNITATGNITVSIAKTGFSIVGSPKQVTIYLGDEVITGIFGDFEYEYGSITKKVTISKYLKELDTVTSITVPGTINNMPVVAIKDGSVTKTGDGDKPKGVFGYYNYHTWEQPNNATITTITLPDSITYIGDAAFAGLFSLTTINLPSSLTHIGSHAFFSNRNLKTINSPQGITYIGDYAFLWCNLTSFNIPNGVTYLGSDAFCGNKLTQVNIPTGITELKRYVFGDCPLYYINIPHTITRIEERALSVATLKNKKLRIPSNVQYISSHAFSAAYFYVEGIEKCELEEIEILGDNVTVEKAPIYYDLSSSIDPLNKITVGNNIDFQQANYIDEFDEKRKTLKGFIPFYNNNGKEAGTYLYDGENWVKE
jgi:hypothetical protein